MPSQGKRSVPIHYLRPNHAVWSPPSLICLDTETKWYYEDTDEIHELRLWCARFTDRRKPSRGAIEDTYSDGLNKETLALQIHKWCQRRKTVWLYCHNLTFDMLTSDLIAQLSDMGWTVNDFAVDAGSPFARLSRGDHNLTLSDSFGWLPKSMDTIGQSLSIPKPALPANDDSDEAWLTRCKSDVKILSEAMLTLMRWWDDNQLGRWNITGAASGWNAMRHIPSPDRILINPDEAQCDADRAAIYGGRRFCWQTGELPKGRYVELDIEKAYTVATRDMPLPVERMAHFTSLPLEHKWLDSDRLGVIAECVIATDSPRYPCRYDGRVWYPVGTFTTTLAGPEIRSARDRGELVSVGAGYVHELGVALRPWATWLLDAQRPDNASTPDVAKICLRSWARSAIGKWAQRGYERIKLGPSPERVWGYQDAWDHAAGVKASIVDFGGQRWQVSATGTADNAYPAILAFVESYVRVALSAAIDAIGEKHLISCDTDGMICSALSVLRSRSNVIRESRIESQPVDPLQSVIASASARAAPFRLRDKSSYHQVTVLGPQHLKTDQLRRYSGIPGSAEDVDGNQLVAQLWPKLAWQIRHGRQGAYVRPRMTYRMAATYAPGWVLLSGAVRPVELSIDSDGTNQLRPWQLTRWRAAGARLAATQSKALARYG